MIGAGYDNGDVKMWDLRNMKLYWDINVGNRVFSLEYNRRDIKVSTREATFTKIFSHQQFLRTSANMVGVYVRENAER